MLIAIIGENCSGKSTLARALAARLSAEIIAGKDWLRMAKSEAEALSLFRGKLQAAACGPNLICVISEPEPLAWLPEGTVRILVTADLETIKQRFRARLHGNLPAPVERMLERKHGMFDGGQYDFRFDGVKGDTEAIYDTLRERIEKTMHTNHLTIRLEEKSDYSAVENLVREAFWNVYRPGCSEHYVIHVLRDDPAFVKELDFVMERDGWLIGQNMFMRTVIEADDGRVIPVLTMGPIGITPELKRKGYGKKLLDYSLEKAAALGFGAVLFEGNIGFYGKSGFDYARSFGIRYHDLPEGADDSFFLCKELVPGYLNGITGVYQTPKGYYVDDADVEAFDKAFPPKEKLKLPGQLF